MQMYQIVIVVSLAFVLAWREARRVNLGGACGYFLIIFVAVLPISDYRFSPDVVNVTVFFCLFLVAMLLWHIYANRAKLVRNQ